MLVIHLQILNAATSQWEGTGTAVYVLDVVEPRRTQGGRDVEYNGVVHQGPVQPDNC